MVRRETSADIEEAAADWTARLDRAPLSIEEQAAFDEWLAGDARRFGAYAKACAVMAHADRARALRHGPAPAERLSQMPSRRWLVGGGAGAIAAGLAGVVGVALLGRQSMIATGKGEIRLAPLPDGSSVTLNTASKIKIDFSGTVRRTELIAGEALFEVAKDRRRPFIVFAGDTQVRAVGTAFTVRRLGSGAVKVVVREGVVEVSRPASAPVRVAANSAAVAGPVSGSVAPGAAAPAAAAPIVKAAMSPNDVNRALAWREGMLAFDGTTLKDAAAEFARYSDTRIVIDDTALANETIIGLFSANNPKGFARTVAASLNAESRVNGDEVHIYR